MITIKVSDLVSRVNTFLHRAVNLSDALISGELSNVKYVNGHCYFDLKDENGQLSCTLWRSYAARAGFRLEDGMAVLVHGSLNIYEKRGSLQLSVDSIEPAGLGALYLELEKQKKLLAAQGYFDADHKKSKPAEISRIAIVTGASTAALQDVMKTIHTRWPMLETHLFAAPVQGKDAPPRICEALRKADAAGMDAVLLVRGGGSFEDLFCFNDPQIVRTLYDMKTYTVTGIGHEIDTSLADLAADHRALTPTAAAQWVTPDQTEVRARLNQLDRSMKDSIRRLFEANAQKLMYLQASAPLSSPQGWIEARRNRSELLAQRLLQQAGSRLSGVESLLDRLCSQLQSEMNTLLDERMRQWQSLNTSLYINSPNVRLSRAAAALESRSRLLQSGMETRLSAERASLEKNCSLLQALSPQRILEHGYSIVTVDGHPVRDAASLCVQQQVSLRFAKGSAQAVIAKTDTES